MKHQQNASTSHDEDEECESIADFDKSWTKIVKNAYRKARENFEWLVESEGKEPYRKAVTCARKYKIDPIEEQEDEEIFNLKIKKCVDSKNKIQPITLEAITPMPPMIYWTLTEMNIKADDELTLSHIPYMGESDKSFTKDLMEAFPDGIHGTKVGCGEYINDFILYHTVKYCEDENSEIPSDKLYRLIYELFPNKIQKHELVEILPDLRSRFAENLAQSSVQFDDKGFQRENVTPSSLLHSYEVLQCQKCALYDSNVECVSRKRHLDDPFAIQPNPCSGDCYLSQKDAISNAFASTTPKRRTNGSLVIDIQSGKKQSGKQPIVHWSPQEESMMALLKSVGINDCCIIARTLMQESGSINKKTCNDVYDYYRNREPLSPRVNVQREMPIKKRDNAQLHRQFRSNKLHEDGKVQNQHAYIACNHPGRPCNDSCSCYQRDKICTKYCACYDDGCKLQFPGCRCSAGNCRTKQCPCYYASWECDPDTCRNCHCAPEDETNDPTHPKCKNVCFQRGLQKKLSARPSQVAGWGCFTDERIEKNEFVSEYCGEIISHEESERRARISDKYGISYLFKLNNDQHVDATRKGNIIRFANHSKNPNCYAKVVVVNTEHRIGIFAKRQIEVGEELFFDYSYTNEHELNFLNRELKHTKSKAIVKKEVKFRGRKFKQSV